MPTLMKQNVPETNKTFKFKNAILKVAFWAKAI